MPRIEIKQVSEWVETEVPASDDNGETYTRVSAEFEVTAFGKTRRGQGRKMMGKGDTRIMLSSALTLAVKRGRAGTKAWPFQLMISLKDDGTYALYSGASYGHQVNRIIGWWDEVPAEQKSKHY